MIRISLYASYACILHIIAISNIIHCICICSCIYVAITNYDAEDVKLRPRPPDFGGRSYNSMLLSYADKTKQSGAAPTSCYGFDTLKRDYMKEEEEDDDTVEITLDDMTLAQTMNFEVVNVDDTMTARTKDVKLFISLSVSYFFALFLILFTLTSF